MWGKFGMLRRIRWGLVAAGLLTMLFGVYLWSTFPEAEHNLTMLAGMITGAGSGVLAVGVVVVISNRRMTPEQKKQADIDCADERNIAIQGKAFFVSGCAAALFSMFTSFLLVGLGYRVAAYLVLGGLYFQLLTLLAAMWYYHKRM